MNISCFSLSHAHWTGVLPIAVAQEKASKAEEHLKEINLLFKKLKVIYKNLQPIPNVNDDQGGLLLDIDTTEVSKDNLEWVWNGYIVIEYCCTVL